MSIASPPRTTESSRPSSLKRRTQGFDVIRWIEANCCHTAAEWVGRPFQFLPWQKRLILELFTVDAVGLRQYRWALVGVAKKNGKTELAAALALYFLIADGEPSPLVVVAAASEEQADLVFGAAATMARMSPTLSQITEVYGKEILVPSIPGAKLKRVAAAAGTNDGQNIHAVICDELHEWVGRKGRDVWTVLTNGTGSRRQPVVMQITTAGFDIDGTVCGEQYKYGEAVNAGEIKDARYLHHWIQAPANADHKDPAVWEAANPSWGITIPRPMEFFADQLTKKTEGEFRRYFLNQWTDAEEVWEAASLWDALGSDLELDPALPLFVGMDAGLRHDSSAVVWCQRVGGRYVLRAKVWENPYPYGTRQHDSWKFQISELEDLCRELAATYPVAAVRDERGRALPGPAFHYDPFMLERSAQMLAAEGLAMIEYPQNDSRMIPASQALFELVKQGVITHDGNPELRRHIRNVVAEVKPRGWRISKPKGSTKHIDAAIAAALAVFEASRNEPAPPPAGIWSFDLDDLNLEDDPAPEPVDPDDAE